MPKKAPPPKPHQRSHSKGWNKRKALLALILLLSLVGIILAQWGGFKRTTTSLNFLQSSPTPQLTKEYIYAGGKLVATEVPITASPLAAPASLLATGTSTPTLQVNLSWSASTGGTVAYYVVERCQSFGPNCYSVVAPNVQPTTPTITYSDSTVANEKAYLYRVRAVDSNGNFSGYSSADLATAISFTDDPLISSAENQSAATPIRAVHITQLRSAVNAVRVLANLSPFTWTNTVQAGSTIRAVDVQEMRTQLDQARSSLGLAAATYTNEPLSAGTTLIKKIHLEELRQAVK
jgi:hypothetical protein